MRVFLSCSHKDEALAARLEDALRLLNIETWSGRDLAPGEDWNKAADEASAKADGYIFLLGADSASDPHVLSEWRNMLRNDWESKKPFIPIFTSKKLSRHRIPPFLRNRQILSASNFDELPKRLVYLLHHPAETRDHRRDEQGRRELGRRLEEIEEFALALKRDSDHTESGAERQ
jgi:TIR domain